MSKANSDSYMDIEPVSLYCWRTGIPREERRLMVAKLLLLGWRISAAGFWRSPESSQAYGYLDHAYAFAMEQTRDCAKSASEE